MSDATTPARTYALPTRMEVNKETISGKTVAVALAGVGDASGLHLLVNMALFSAYCATMAVLNES